MKTSLKISAYGAALAVLVAGTYFAGTAVGPTSESSPAAVGAPAEHADDGHATAAVAHDPGGLASTGDGYTLVPESTTLGSGTFAFRITGPDGSPVTGFDVVHDRQLHLVVVRRDATGFQHVHPERDAAGTWRVPLTVPAAGVYRAFADFSPTGGPATTLGVDLFAPGDFQPVAHPPTRSTTVDGHTVDPRRRPHGRRRVTAHAHRQPRRCARRRAALPRRVRPPRGPARGRPRVPARAPPQPTPRPGPRSGSTPRCPARAPTGCSSTSRSTAWCARPTSRWSTP